MSLFVSKGRLAAGAGCAALATAVIPSATMAQTTAAEQARPDQSPVQSEPSAAGSSPQVRQRDPDGGEIVVTGSRIDRAGFAAPNPTIRVTAEDLQVGARTNVAAALNDLPQFKASTSPQTGGTNTTAGQAPVDLRGLGASRTLVLLDGRRFASDNDLNTIPTVLIRSADVVTGGASAAWGSGAVAGVVNIVIDDRIEGLRLGVQGGVSSYRDAGERRAEAAFGTAFADGKGHFIIGGEYLDNDGVIPKVSRPNVGRWASVPDGNGRFVLAPNVGFANAAYGGIILSGVLRGQAFNPDGSLRVFNGGRVSGTTSIGGEGPSNDDVTPLVTPQRRYAGLARVTYDVLSDVKATLEVRHSRMFNDYVWLPDNNRGNLTIRRENAFLPQAVRDRLTAAGQTSFTFGRFNSDFAFSRIDFERKTTQGTFALDGRIGDDLRWGGYYTHGEFQNNIATPGLLLTANYAQAVDSIISPTTGQPICRVALTNPTTACVPINLFGYGAPSAAATAFVTGRPSTNSTQKLDVAGFSLRGEPFALPAGDVSFAVGVEGRRESINATVSARDAAKAYQSLNFTPLKGDYTVKEAFGEILVPLIHDVPLIRQFEVNAAARISDYSNTGSIWSWKIGATNEFLPGLRGRVTLSRDIRSANLSELFTIQAIGASTIADPQTKQSVSVTNIGGGNPNLLPEIGKTFTGGFSFSPRFIPGLDLSIDYYDIRIRDVITTITSQDLVNRCFNGNQALCAQVDRDSAGNLIRTRSTFVNLSRYQTDGIDAELSYRLPVASLFGAGDGNLRFRGFATWINSLVADDGVSRIEYVRSQGNAFNFGAPKWRATGSIGYDGATWSGLVRARYISPGNFNNTIDIVNNRIGAFTYVDLQAAVRVPTGGKRQFELYTNVTNLFDKDPPPAALFSPYYDVIGRYITVGARVRF